MAGQIPGSRWPGILRPRARTRAWLVHNWRVERLTGLGVPRTLAETFADHLDWHQVARLVQGGCPPQLALRIVL